MDSNFVLGSLLFISISICIVIHFWPYRLPLPPGPHGSLLFGVKHQLPKSEPWKTYFSWGEQFESYIISFRVYNRLIIVLNNAESVKELLERRANIYSDRPKSWMYHEICDRGKSIFNISSSDARHRQYRKILRGELGSSGTKAYWPLLESEVGKLLTGLRNSPEKYQGHIRRNATGVIMKMAYGYTVLEDDPFISVAEEAAKISGWATAPGRWLVDYFPIVRFIPSWLPGTGWKQQGESWRKRLDVLSGVTHEWVKQQMAIGKYTESFTSRLLRPDGGAFVDAEQEDIIKWCAGGLYAGAADTTVSAIISFILLMALYPAVQLQLHTELDEVIGLDQLPCASDVHRLPFLNAVLKEVLRYAPIANFALPHMVTKEDEYAGFRIPQNSTIIANVWAIMHDPSNYPDPFIFSPHRFHPTNADGKETQPDPRGFAFGFGHRTCPGIQFAETTMLLTMASIASQFSIRLPSGKCPPNVEFTSGITRFVVQCCATPTGTNPS
ncbi:cytochrome P450 [Infundibulicybe gibba]|nr:cytochrome P450 [Infundibulicybe gibba]